MTSSPVITFVHPYLHEDSRRADFPVFRRGHEAWGVQVPLRLKEAGLPIRLSSVVPESGIVVVHRDLLPDNFEPDERYFLVVMRGDRLPHPTANFEVVLNPLAAVDAGGQRRRYMPMFPQQNLIARDVERGERFETIVYMGAPEQLHPMLRSAEFAEFLRARGIEFRIETDPERWHDFSQVDAVIAVRPPGIDELRKPANKLINAWFAHTPAILGPEAAYRHHRRSEFDYLEVQTLEDAKAAVAALGKDPHLRKVIADSGAARASDFTPEATAERWRALLIDEVLPAATTWFGSASGRHVYTATRDLCLAREYARNSGARAALAFLRTRVAARRRGEFRLVAGAPTPGKPT